MVVIHRKLTVPFTYIATDYEFEGPIPGLHSMLSFGSVAVAENGEFLGEFKGVLERLEGAESDPTTMNFWRRYHHRAILVTGGADSDLV
ncbi:hypothetical protein QFZ34_000508 [Phyllobacterium ifriqiyense]|uniref:Uncharacterized protein n=1 Tax=Phyllobacterium ifriqiyense TaxID=314238 RepID=A0ABU0S4A4_9HYPH|nr:hypothetical protein [Phyllobacterium ifriqiyense]MDQ0995331.1 hypothetical protein [Phyllobacterium ifriqiyense]